MAEQRFTFEGEDVRHMQLAVTGRSGLVPRLLHIGDEITLVLVGTVTKVTHQESETGLVRAHTVKVAEAYPVDDEGGAFALLAELRDRDRKLLDEMLGRKSLFDDGPDPETGEIP